MFNNLLTNTEYISVEEVLTATYRVNNSAEKTRLFNISADVSVSGNDSITFNNGRVERIPEDESIPAKTVAVFTSWQERGLNITFESGKSEQAEILTEVNSFIENVADAFAK